MTNEKHPTEPKPQPSPSEPMRKRDDGTHSTGPKGPPPKGQ
jgi:hypothetical protein